MAKTLDEAGVKRLIREIKGANKDLHSPIAISSENTTESMAQNVKNIADYVEKAKAAGIADVNGMAVTCLIDNDYSGVGYIYAAECIIGTTIADDLADNQCFVVQVNGEYSIRTFVTVGDSNLVSSSMLTQGARNPIIFTPDTTEVDEETYQKLLSDDVDVLFKTSDGEFCTHSYEDANTDYLNLYFTCFSVEGETLGDIFIYAYRVEIGKNAPHTCTINILQEAQTIDDVIISYDYIKESTIFPLLQEIDLNVSSDENRKSRLELFEENWEALTGTNDLSGARFIGNVPNLDNSGGSSVLFINQSNLNHYVGCAMNSDVDKMVLRYTLSRQDGSLTITPLFSHLEAITIYTDNTDESKQHNIDNLNAYKTNLGDLGVDIDYVNFQIPVTIYDAYAGSLYYSYYDKVYVGVLFATDDGNGVYFIRVELDGTYSEVQFAFNEGVEQVKTLAKNKQDKLISGTNIKTINNQSLLGSGNIEISAPSITVDTTMSDTSTNPVQNKVIKAYVDGLVGNVAA